MNCEELLRQLNDYVDGDIDPAVCDGFEEHLAGCNPCQVVVDTIRKTITLYREDGRRCEMPAPFESRLHAALRERWRERNSRS